MKKLLIATAIAGLAVQLALPGGVDAQDDIETPEGHCTAMTRYYGLRADELSNRILNRAMAIQGTLSNPADDSEDYLNEPAARNEAKRGFRLVIAIESLLEIYNYAVDEFDKDYHSQDSVNCPELIKAYYAFSRFYDSSESYIRSTDRLLPVEQRKHGATTASPE